MADCGCNTFPASLGNVTFEASVGISTTTPGGVLDVAGGQVALDNGDYGTPRGIRFRDTTDTSTPSGGGLYQGSDNQVSLQAGSANLLNVRDASGQGLVQFNGGSEDKVLALGTPSASGAFVTVQPTTDAAAAAGFRLLTGTGSQAATLAMFPNSASDQILALVNNTPGPIVLYANGAEQFRVTASGAVGIGTPTPNATLQVNGGVTTQALIESQGYSDVALGAPISFTGGSVGSGGGPTLTGHQSFWQASATGQQMTVDLGGIVDFITGISLGAYQRGDLGSMPLAYAIDYSTDDLNWTNLVTVTNNLQTSVIHLGFSVTARYLRLTVNAFQSGQTTANVAAFRVYSTADSAMAGKLPWGILPGIDPNNVVLASIGNVGIGTTSPGARLHVTGDGSDLKVWADAGGNGYAGLRVSNSDRQWIWQITPSSDPPAGRLRLVDESVPAERLTITTAGDVGIGTSNPGGVLDVAGGFVALDNGDFSGNRGIQFRNTTDPTTPRGGGIYQANNDNLYIQAGAGNQIRLRSTNLSGGNGADIAAFDTASGSTLYLLAGGQLRMLDTDSTTALQIADYHGNPFVDFDSINHQVGIGTSSPLATLHLDQGGTQSQDTLLIGNNTTKGLQFRDTGGAVDLESIGVALFVNSTTQQPIYLNPSGGNVGVGTNNPQVVLDVNGDVRSDAALQVFRDVDGTVPNRPDQIYLQGVSNPNLKMYVGFDTTNQVGLIQALEEGVAWRNISFVRDGGNVGIGTTSPASKLAVTTTAIDDGVMVLGANSQNVFLLTNLGNSAYNSLSQPNDRGLIYAGASIDNPGGGLVIAPWKSNASGIRLDPSGNVGIGKSSPQYPLDVTGDIGTSGNLHANGLLVSSNILFYDALQNTQSGRTVADQNGCYYGP